VEAAARYLPEQESALGQHATGRGHYGLAVGSLGACLPVALGPVGLGPCVGAELGAIWGSTTGVSDPGAATSAFMAPWASGLATVAVTPWLVLRLDVGVAVPVLSTEFIVDGVGTVHTPSPVSFRAGLGAEVHFR
jgi:hypothetical protein